MYYDLFKLTIAFVAILLLAGIGSAATISVGPGERIQSAIDDANDGDVILVQSGVYRENLNVNKQLTINGENTGGGKPVIDAGGDGNGISLNADEVTVQGLGVTNARIGIDVISSNNAIIGNEVKDSWTGIALRSSGGNLLKDNLARDSWRGIYLKDSADNDIFGNAVRDNRWSGIVFESSDNNLVKENVVRANYRGIELINSEENTFIDNELAENKYNDEPSSGVSTRDLEDIV
jgi:parallel beta-helix repeat protein